MARIHAVVTLPHTTNLPRDVTINTFAFNVPQIDPGCDEVRGRLAQFYSSNGVGELLSTVISRLVPARVEMYDIDDPIPRTPVYVEELTVASPGGTSNLPNEVCICASIQGLRQSGTPLARARGRVYIGPLRNNSIDGSGSTYPRIPSGVRGIVADACQNLADTTRADGNPWAVWSRVDNTLRAVTGGWVEDEPDTQRRRQHRSTVRTLWDSPI